jgi:hypothetical protein
MCLHMLMTTPCTVCQDNTQYVRIKTYKMCIDSFCLVYADAATLIYSSGGLCADRTSGHPGVHPAGT